MHPHDTTTPRRKNANRVYKRTAPAERFWRQVDRSGGPDACWPYLGTKTDKGYGVFRIDSKPGGRLGAHRFALQQALGRDISDGSFACHRCDNPSCCNPAHLFEGTQVDNMADMKRKGRAPDPRRIGGPRTLTEDQVREIRSRCERGEKHQEIADAFGVTRTLITQIRSRRKWAHVT